MVGSFVGGRSQIVICKALRILKEKGERFHFFFVGRKSVQEPLLYDDCIEYCSKHQLFDCVHFLGNRNDIPAILQHIDGFVYSTRSDTFGIAVVEAIASYLPTIVNDWDVMKEITQDGKLAQLFKTDDSEDCSLKMISLIRNLDGYKQQAVLNAMQIRRVFSIKSHIDSLSKVYYDVVE